MATVHYHHPRIKSDLSTPRPSFGVRIELISGGIVLLNNQLSISFLRRSPQPGQKFREVSVDREKIMEDIGGMVTNRGEVSINL